MATPLGPNSHPHFKLPPAQGWALKCYEHDVAELQRKEAIRVGYRRQRLGLDPERTREVSKSLDILLAGVTEGSGKLYDGLPASSLDGQVPAVAITAHLARPAIPLAPALLRGLCAAAGLCLDRATGALRENNTGLQRQAAAIGEAVERSRSFWRAMLDGLPEGCHAPLSSTCRWQRRAHCKHQGRRLCLGEPPWQPKSANAAVAAPRRARASRGASSASATSRLCGGLRSGLSTAASAASTAAVELCGVFCSSSTSSR